MRAASVLAALALVAVSAANAQTYQYTARTASPAARTGAVTAGGLTWQCAGSECRISGPWLAPGVSACAALAAQVGRIASYGRSGAMLDPDQLNQCNANLPAATLQIDPRAARQIPPQQRTPQIGPLVRAPSSPRGPSAPSMPAAPAATSQVAIEPGGRPEDLVVHVLSIPAIRFHGVTPAISAPTPPAPLARIVEGRIETAGVRLQASAPGATPTPRSSSTPETPQYSRGRSDVVLRVPVSLRDMPADTWGIEFSCALFTSRFTPWVTRERRPGEPGTGPVTEIASDALPFHSASGRSADREVATGGAWSFVRSIGNYSATFDIPLQTRPFFRLQDARSYHCTVHLQTSRVGGVNRTILSSIAGPSGPEGFRPAAGTTPILTVEGNLQ